MRYTFTLKDQYKKLKEIYPDIEVKVEESFEVDDKHKTFGNYLTILNVVTGCYDKLWISENFKETFSTNWLIISFFSFDSNLFATKYNIIILINSCVDTCFTTTFTS